MPGDVEECPLPLEGGGGVATVAVDRFLVGLKALRFHLGFNVWGPGRVGR